MNRPAPRKSTLTGRTPAAPVSEAQAEPIPSRSPIAVGESPQVKPKPKNPPKVSFYQNPDDTARLRAAYAHTHAVEGYRSMSDLIDRAVMAEVNRLEERHNGGKPWQPVAARNIPQGRPLE